MNSKMRPQMLAFDNVDRYYQKSLGQELKDVVLIYKKGDDLRQDSLTLQMLKVICSIVSFVFSIVTLFYLLKR